MSAAVIGFATLVALCLFGVRVGFAALLVGLVGFALNRGAAPALAMVAQQVFQIATDYNLSVIPLFLLMGAFLYRSEVATDLYDSAHSALGKIRGGLALATVLACGGFAAVCGSTLATAATMARVAMPQMKAFGYSDRLAAGTVAAGGTLGIMIPPSVPLVIYGIIAEQDIARLFVAGILPGLLLVVLFLLAVAVTVGRDPKAAPDAPPLDADRRGQARRGAIPVLVLFVVVLGGIYGGVFTPTEASGVGAGGAALIALRRGRLRRPADWGACLVEAGLTSARIFAVLFGATVFAQFINLSGLPYDILDLVERAAFSPTQLVLFIIALAVAMGMVFDSIGILVLLVPVFLPALYQSGVDMIWFGIIVVIVTEIGLITPPIGMNVLVVKSVMPEVKPGDIFRGVVPFVLALLGGLLLIFAVPGIATLLPDLMS